MFIININNNAIYYIYLYTYYNAMTFGQVSIYDVESLRHFKNGLLF